MIKTFIIIILAMLGFIGLGVLLGRFNKKRKEEEEFRKWHDPIVMNPENF